MPHLTPPNLEGLVQLSRKEGVDIRPSLLRVLTDLYVQEQSHTREEEQQYVELALRLLPVVDPPTRAAVAGKLAIYSLAPDAVVEHLAREIAELPEPVVPRVPDAEGSARGERSPTNRPAPSKTMRPASGRSMTPAELHDALRDGRVAGTAETEPPLGERFMQADGAERRRLLEQLDQEAASSADPSVPAQRQDVINRLEAAALQRNQREFARELQHALDLSRPMALRIVRDSSGEPTLVVAAAIEMPLNVLVRILLFLNPTVGESVERVFALARFYERVPPAAAMQIVASWRDEALRRVATRYAGVHAEDAHGTAAELTDNARRPITGRTAEPTRVSELARTFARQRTT